ncbi:MAG: hypothetical protein HQL12_02935 [Candidatus Omnitrophica bacterium]|nr:hypothetical protein [Candidatus Omnitrophota bacterium]
MLLRCTQKFLTELRLKKSEIAELPGVLHPLDEWYAHVFFLYPRRKCAIFMHANTGFCFFAFDRTRNQLNDIRGLFRKCLGRALFDEHYPGSVIKLFNERLEDIKIGQTIDRKIVSLINRRLWELGYMSDYSPDDQRVHDEFLAGLDFRREITLKDYRYPIERMRDLLADLEELKGTEIPMAKKKHEVLEAFFETLRQGRQLEKNMTN